MIYYAPTIFKQLGLDGNTVRPAVAIKFDMSLTQYITDRHLSWPPVSMGSLTA